MNTQTWTIARNKMDVPGLIPASRLAVGTSKSRLTVKVTIRSVMIPDLIATGLDQSARSTQNVTISSTQRPLPKKNVVMAARSTAMVAKLLNPLLAVVLMPRSVQVP